MGLIAKYQERGFSFFPLRKRSKKPVFDWAVWQTRRPSAEEVATWQEQKLLTQVAIVCGAVSGLVVLDIDEHEKFDAWLNKQRHQMPKSPTVKTGKGWHVYFRHPGGKIKNAVRKIPGADLKADGGYVVAPPSIHPDGAAYEWVEGLSFDEAELADLPAWLLEFLEKEVSGQVEISDEDLLPPEEDWVAQALCGVCEGERDNTATRLAGYYLGRGEPEGRVLEMLRSWNLRNTEPLPDKDLRKVVNSVGRSEAKKRVREGVGQGESGSKHGKEALPWDEERAARLQGLSDLLGLPITDIKVTKTNQSIWEVVLGDEGSVVLDSLQLTSQTVFRRRFCEAANLLPKNVWTAKGQPSKWDKVIREIMSLAVILESDPEATAIGEVRDLINGFLVERPRIEYFSKTKKIPLGVPFFIVIREDGPALYMRLPELIKEAKYSGFNFTRTYITNRMPNLGHTADNFKWCGQTVRAWRLNLEEVPQEAKEYVHRMHMDHLEEVTEDTQGHTSKKRANT